MSVRSRIACRSQRLLVLLLGLAWLPPGQADPPAPRCECLVFVILGGGVRTQDALDRSRMPTLDRLAREGTLVDRVRSEARDGWAAAARLLTGADEGLNGATRRAPGVPTILEYAREGLALPREQVWFLSYDLDSDAGALAVSTHPEYGPSLAPASAPPGGPFAGPLQVLLERMGRPLPMPEAAWEPLRAMRATSRAAASVWIPRELDSRPADDERVERALLRELDRRALLVEGPNARDEAVWRAARTVLDVHTPQVLVLRLGDAEVASADATRYLSVLAANDKGLGRLLDSVEAHPTLRGRTAVVVALDRGRDERQDDQGRLRETDASRARREVMVVAWGAGLIPRRKPRGPRALEDVCPTLGALLGVPTPHARGRAWDELLVPVPPR